MRSGKALAQNSSPLSIAVIAGDPERRRTRRSRKIYAMPHCTEVAARSFDCAGVPFSLRTHPRRSRPGGFSLVEIMIVVVIIGLMAGLVTYATAGYLERAKRQRARSDIATFSGAVDSYYLARGMYPGNDQGLKALTPEFVKVVQNDPWGNPYLYVHPGKNGPYDIISYGADGREGGTGADADISSSDAEVIEANHK